MAAAAAVGGCVTVRNVIPKHLDCISAKLREMGAKVTEYDDAITVEKVRRLRRTHVKTMPYPGFPTDMQPQVGVCMALAQGTSIISEGIYDTRFRYCSELNRMGAAIQVDTKMAVVEGVEKLHGSVVKACAATSASSTSSAPWAPTSAASKPPTTPPRRSTPDKSQIMPPETHVFGGFFNRSAYGLM